MRTTQHNERQEGRRGGRRGGGLSCPAPKNGALFSFSSYFSTTNYLLTEILTLNTKTTHFSGGFCVTGPSTCAEHENAPSLGAFSCLAPSAHAEHEDTPILGVFSCSRPFRMCRARKRTQFRCVFMLGTLFSHLPHVPGTKTYPVWVHFCPAPFCCSTLFCACRA